MKERELSIERILEINEALNMALKVEDLPNGLTTIEIGLFSDRISSYVKNFNKAIEIERKKTLQAQSKLDKKDPKWALDHELLNTKYHENVEKIKVSANENKKGERVKCPEFKQSDFIAADDTSRFVKSGDGKPVEIKIKKGQALLPAIFFKKMGDLIV